jgi:hypothetical protein
VTKKERNRLVAKLAELEARLNRGFEMKGERVDRHFEKLLQEYEDIYDELKAAGHV